MAGFKGAAPRFFEATNVERGNRPEHVMVAGGRDGPEIGNIPPKDPAFWRVGESARWTSELQGGRTPVSARTQPPFLLEVRPQQREWERGFMPLKDILAVWQKGKESSYIRSEKPEVELTLFQQDEEGKTTFANIRVLVVDAPIFVGTEEMSDAARGAPLEVSNPSQPKFELITRAAQEMAKLGAPFYITYRGSGGGVENVTLFKTRLVNKETLSGTTRSGEEPISITRRAIVQMSLFPPGTAALLDSPIWRRLTGAKIQPLNVQSGLAEGTVLPLPFMFIARTRLIYPQAKDKPSRVASEFTGKTEKADLALERAAEYLKALKTEAMIKQARALRKQEKGRDADPSPTIALGETGFRVKLTKDQRLVWVSGGQPDPVALLTGSSSPRGDIVVTPEDYLRVVGLPPVSRSKRKRKTPMRANPIVYYRSQAELDNLLAVLGQREYDKLLAKGGIKHISEKPAREKVSSEQYYIPAGRRAAQSGVGLKISRRNPSSDYSILSDLPDPSVVYRNPMQVADTHESWQALLAQVRRSGNEAQYQNLHALYRAWAAKHPSEDWSRSHRGDLVRTTGSGDDYLRNPRQFRGVKQAMSPSEKERARLMRKHSGTSLTRLLTSYDPEEQAVGEYIERGLSRQSKKAAGTYRRNPDFAVGARVSPNTLTTMGRYYADRMSGPTRVVAKGYEATGYGRAMMYTIEDARGNQALLSEGEIVAG